ncbi:hypothetical protein GQ53DRAFT_834608 [Thozetella sp. PMI_491]|nr:hypothetical protein GQ53DRAFT_834608 [Thozetella sp. PMI_491]
MPFIDSPTSCAGLTTLSSEVLFGIFEALHDREDLVGVRCVCRRFDAIATSVFYRTVSLNARIIGKQAGQAYSRALHNIETHTRHLVVPSDLDVEEVEEFLLRIPNVLSIRWIYVHESEIQCAPSWVPSDILDQPRFKDTKLYVEALPLPSFDDPKLNAYTTAIPARLLRSLKLASPTPPLTTKLHSLKQLLLQSRDLETLHYEDRGQGTRFSFQGRERLPPLKELSLKCYDWTHSKEAVKTHWDFSQIRSLDLIHVPIFNVLSSLHLPDLVGLQHFHGEDFSAHHPDRRVEATRLMWELIRFHVHALKSLHITCYTRMFPVEALLLHSATLEHLSFRDFAGFDDENHRCPTFGPIPLARLSSYMKVLKSIELDMDATLTDPRQFLQTLAQFPSLHTIVLHVHTVVDPYEDTPASEDADLGAACGLFHAMYQLKETSSTPKLRQMTIKVGGWKPVLVRRLSDAWREKNRQGIYAERCFTANWQRDGQFCLREAKPLGLSKIDRGEVELYSSWATLQADRKEPVASLPRRSTAWRRTMGPFWGEIAGCI